jgi:hypothetical protein
VQWSYFSPWLSHDPVLNKKIKKGLLVSSEIATFSLGFPRIKLYHQLISMTKSTNPTKQTLTALIP